MLESLLINFLFLLIPVVIFLIFFENRPTKINKYISILLPAVTMVLCMHFPIKLKMGYIFDLRYIPFIIVALFGGYKYSFSLYAVLNIYRFMIGGEGTIQSFIFSTVIFILAGLPHKSFMKQSPKNRIITATSAAFITMVLYLSSMVFFLPALNREYWTLTINALTTYVVFMLIIMILVEQIIRNKKTRESYLHSEKLHIISELSASVSHEIRNPLTVTSGFLQLLKQSKTVSEEDKRYIDFSLSEVRRAEKIVNDFLAFAKPQSENMIESNLKDEAEYVKDIITPYANMHHVTIDFHFQNSLHFKYDKNQIQQCLINLYKNGIEAMKGKGGTLSIHVTEQKKHIVVMIKDEGVGMTSEEISRLGSPYYSTKKEGTGLGMLMVYSTVHKINGKIEVVSEKGKGTTFTIRIPA
ncbi:HAMP domain-containing sensor histidine kinase [Neobacillus sp. PS3-12]|uniref:HAMP domain-containing sensor histidine kinase n=1 Tax=Neobacillus sp. PS3-12 TaxID=3070677 RepID=UPI0027DF7BC0|nr:HAMP domain-containing sensor histidine kinase [Neobacillus sp. PS3-12]WML54720.1 HAMP domain-containing sensor histidine kinase [Neobacillus sp. PS3-12]